MPAREIASQVLRMQPGAPSSAWLTYCPGSRRRAAADRTPPAVPANAGPSSAGLRLDRTLRGRRQRRVRQVLAQDGPRPGQPGMEGLLDGINFAGGQLAELPIALAEVQGYAYAANRVHAASRCRPQPSSSSSSTSSRAEPRRSISRDPHRDEWTICTAVAPDVVFPVRRYGAPAQPRPSA